MWYKMSMEGVTRGRQNILSICIPWGIYMGIGMQAKCDKGKIEIK